jgi:hypothetical protein
LILDKENIPLEPRLNSRQNLAIVRKGLVAHARCTWTNEFLEDAPFSIASMASSNEEAANKH